jgi:hypothetical protein
MVGVRNQDIGSGGRTHGHKLFLLKLSSLKLSN